MTFEDNYHPLQVVIDRKNDTFGEWAIRHSEMLFLPKREPNYSLTSIKHFFMNRLGQQYSEIMLMEENERDEIFKLEKEIMDKENQQK